MVSLSRHSRYLVVIVFLAGCVNPVKDDAQAVNPAPVSKELSKRESAYHIGPGDTIKVFVWRNPEISVTVPVRPDGKISTPLVENMQAVGKTPARLARDIERVLSAYIRNPVVTVIVTDFVGTFGEQIRVVGQAAKPQALAYRDDMTLLDVMIEVGGLTEFAAGNQAKIIRREEGQSREIKVRLTDLLNKGDISTNVMMAPGDVVIIPESWF